MVEAVGTAAGVPEQREHDGDRRGPVAPTAGPGLIGALLVGLSTAKALAAWFGRLERLGAIERSVLRLGAAELMKDVYSPLAAADVPFIVTDVETADALGVPFGPERKRLVGAQRQVGLSVGEPPATRGSPMRLCSSSRSCRCLRCRRRRVFGRDREGRPRNRG